MRWRLRAGVDNLWDIWYSDPIDKENSEGSLNPYIVKTLRGVNSDKYKASIGENFEDGRPHNYIFVKEYYSLATAKRGLERFLKNRFKVKWTKVGQQEAGTEWEAGYRNYAFNVVGSSGGSYSDVAIYRDIANVEFTAYIDNKEGNKEGATKAVEEFLEKVYG